MGYIIKKFHEFEIVKKLIFDDNQLDCINTFPKCIVEKSNLLRNEMDLFDMEKFNKIIEKIRSKEEKNKIDNKILERLYGDFIVFFIVFDFF